MSLISVSATDYGFAKRLLFLFHGLTRGLVQGDGYGGLDYGASHGFSNGSGIGAYGP